MPKNARFGYRARRVVAVAGKAKRSPRMPERDFGYGLRESGVAEFRRGDDAVATEMLRFIQGAVCVLE